MIIIKCNSKTCIHSKNGWCIIIGELLIDATEFDNDSTCPPICVNAENKEG
jgi:hypothetical protein